MIFFQAATTDAAASSVLIGRVSAQASRERLADAPTGLIRSHSVARERAFVRSATEYASAPIDRDLDLGTTHRSDAMQVVSNVAA